MKSRIIKDYSNWLNEDQTQPAAAPAQPAADGIAFIGASASASNLGDATKFGFKKDIVYTITMKDLGMLRFLDTDGSKFGGPSSQITVNLDSTEKVAKPGDDMLEINGKKIYETGTLLIKKAETPGPITIKASNNGMLLLIRFGNALADMATRFKFDIGNCKNFAAKFTLGKAVAEADARGFTYYWAKPGTLGPTSNSLIESVAIATLGLLGLKDHIAVTDGSYYKLVAGKDAAGASTEITNRIAGVVKGNRMFTNAPLPDTTAALATITVKDMDVLVQYDERNNKFKLKPEGANRIKEAITKIATAIAPVKPPVDFGDANDVFAGYGDIIKTGLMTYNSAYNISAWFDRVQKKQEWISGSKSPGGSGGQTTATQGEGQVGR